MDFTKIAISKIADDFDFIDLPTLGDEPSSSSGYSALNKRWDEDALRRAKSLADSDKLEDQRLWRAKQEKSLLDSDKLEAGRLPQRSKLDDVLANAKGYAHNTKQWFGDKYDDILKLLSDHPTGTAAGAGAAGGIGGAGIVGAIMGRSKAKQGKALGSRLREMSGKNKKLALLAALGIPASAAAAYFATR